MKSDSLIGRDGAFAFPFKIAWIIVNFYKDGGFEVKSLADLEDLNFPFRDEILPVLSGEKEEYVKNCVEEVVDAFIEKLVMQDAQKIEV